MSVETITTPSPEQLTKETVPEIRNYDEVRSRVDRHIRETVSPEELPSPASLLDSINSLGHQLVSRRFGDTIHVGDTIDDRDSFLTRTPDGLRPEEVFSMHTMTNHAGEREPRRICDVSILLDERVRNIRIDSRNPAITVVDESTEGVRTSLSGEEHSAAVLDLESRLLVASYAAETRPEYEKKWADLSARTLHAHYFPDQT